MTNKTDKELMEEYERGVMDSIEIIGAADATAMPGQKLDGADYVTHIKQLLSKQKKAKNADEILLQSLAIPMKHANKDRWRVVELVSKDETFPEIDGDYLLMTKEYLKQALSRKEEAMIELFRECLPEEEKDTFENDGNVGHLTTGRYCFAFNNCLSQIKDNLKSKGIEL